MGNLIYPGLGSVCFGLDQGASLAGPQTDEVAYQAMVVLLAATGQFETVAYGVGDEISSPNSDQLPFAAIVPRTATPVDTFDEGGMIRTVGYTLTIIVRDESYMARRAKLGYLETVARNALTGQSLAGFTFPAYSKMNQAVMPRQRHPEQRLEIAGSFAYLVDGYASNDTTDLFNYIS